MTVLPEVSPSDLAILARKHGLDGPLERLPSTGIINRVYRASRRGQAVVLRVGVPGLEDGTEDALTEAAAMPAVTRAGVLAPELLAFDNDCDVLDAVITVYGWVPGRSLDRWGWNSLDPRLHRAYRETGRELARLHARVSEVADPHGWLEHQTPPDLERARQQVREAGVLNPEELHWATGRAAELLGDPADWPRAFLHQDLHPGNLMTDDQGQPTALIDWGDAGWGDPALDLCCAGPLAAPHLLRGYEEEIPGGLGSGGEQRVLGYLLLDAARRLVRPPRPDAPDLWYTRPATALMGLLRVLPQVPAWQEALLDGTTAKASNQLAPGQLTDVRP